MDSSENAEPPSGPPELTMPKIPKLQLPINDHEQALKDVKFALEGKTESHHKRKSMINDLMGEGMVFD